MRFHNREDLLQLLGEDFYQFYRRNRKDRFEKLVNSEKVNAAVSKMFATMYEMLEDCNHGISLKNFGTIAPKDFLLEEKKSIFKVNYKKRGSYLVTLESEYLQSQYKTLLLRKDSNPKKPIEGGVIELRKPRPYAVSLHRKNIRKNKTKDAED
jgi:hypothetical protein